MMGQFKRPMLLWLLLLCQWTLNGTNLPPSNTNIRQTTEFRAVWIATINNIDWPSKPNLTVEEQKQEFLGLLDTFQKFKLNVVILQVRAASDAFYQSKTEPWSHFLTGKQGRAPQPFYDPLAWAIEMCHQRGMELHAWFNPFRVRNMGFYQLDPNSFATKHPQYVKEFDKKYFLDPGYPEVVKHVVTVIAEVARNYPIDAIILDDYFYPYPVTGKKFGDEKSFARYGKPFYPKRLGDWRRENINRFISTLHDTLQNINPKIKFGISPFGIWRNKLVDPAGSPGRKGLSSYDDLYADVRKWLVKGWIDYVMPQLYWENGNHYGDFTSLVQWWNENCFGKTLYIGQALYKSTSVKNSWIRPDELTDQINFLRSRENVSGFSFYSASNLKDLSPFQTRALLDNQLNATASIHDDRNGVALATPPNANNVQPVHVPVQIMNPDEFARKDIRLSIESNPLSIRQDWIALGGKVSFVKLKNGERILRWKGENNPDSVWFALVSFKQTGEGRYRQSVEEINKTAEFKFTAQKWEALKDKKLLIVCCNIPERKDRFSNFFQLKRRKTKKVDDPFHHS